MYKNNEWEEVEVPKEVIEENVFFEDEELEKESAESENVSRETFNILDKIKNFFMVESVDKSLEEYENHPLNTITKTENNKRFIRGLEGYVDNTKKAFVDLLLGGLGMLKEMKEKKNDV